MSNTPSPDTTTTTNVVSENSAKAVGYELVKHYYTNLTSNPDSIYALYGKDASLQHHNPFHGEFSRVDSEYTRDCIRNHYKTNSVFQGCKVLIHNVDAQSSFDGSVLILCNGEIAYNKQKDTSPSYRFVQSFYITPKKSDGITYYDIINDILRFIPDIDDDFKLKDDEEVEEEEEEEEKKKKKTNETEIDQDGKQGEVEKETPEDSKSNEKEELKEEEKEEVVVVIPSTTLILDENTTIESQKKEIKQEKKGKIEKENQQPVETSKVPSKISWAARVATSSDNSPSPKNVISSPATSATPVLKDQMKNNNNNNNNNNNKKKLNNNGNNGNHSNGHNNNNNNNNNNSNGNGNGKKSGNEKRDDSTITLVNGKNLKKKFTNKRNEEVYPIYIRGLNNETDDEEQLIKILEREFGKVDSCKLINYVALVDFAKLSSQDKAIEVGSIKLNDHDLKLEPRIEKRKERK